MNRRAKLKQIKLSTKWYQLKTKKIQSMIVVKSIFFIADHDLMRIHESIFFPQLCLSATYQGDAF